MIFAVFFILLKGTGMTGAQGSLTSLSFFGDVSAQTVSQATATVLSTTPTQSQMLELNSLSSLPAQASRSKTEVTAVQQGNFLVSHSTLVTNIAQAIGGQGTEISEYEVQEGDTLSGIAADFGISLNTLIWANNLKNIDSLKPETKLKIPPVSGVIYTIKKGDTLGAIASKYEGEVEKIIAFNSLPQSGDLREGDQLVIPDGKMPAAPAPRVAVYRDSTSKRFAGLPNLGSYFLIPTTGYNWGKPHSRNGVDIANNCGTPILASAAGTVNLAKTSGHNGGYGLFIRITHDNGTETLYAHLSKLLVGVGNQVTKGQHIGVMGTTGRSTGCHLHFEVHGAVNPLAKR